MLNMTEEFEKDRKEEKKFYALINFFKLIIICRLSKANSDLFYLLEGKNKLDQLIRDIQEKNIVLKNKALGDLYTEMHDLVPLMNNRGQGFSLLQAMKEYKNICKSELIIANCEEWNPYDDIGYADLDLLVALPFSIANDDEIKEVLLSIELQKKIGERK